MQYQLRYCRRVIVRLTEIAEAYHYSKNHHIRKKGDDKNAIIITNFIFIDKLPLI